jgi:hypothetical protein
VTSSTATTNSPAREAPRLAINCLYQWKDSAPVSAPVVLSGFLT